MPYALVQNDTGSKLVVTCKDNETKVVIDLTGATVRLKYKIDTGTLQTKTMTVPPPATNGKAEYQWLTAELTPGVLEAQIEITDATSKVLTSLDPILLPIRTKLT